MRTQYPPRTKRSPLSISAAVAAIVALSSGCDRPRQARWQLVDGHFYNYEEMSSEHPISTTFLLDTQTGKVWYAVPQSVDTFITPEFKPVFIDTSTPEPFRNPIFRPSSSPPVKKSP